MMAATLCGSPMYMVRGSSLPLPPQGLVGMALSPRPRRCQPLGSALHVQSRVLVGRQHRVPLQVHSGWLVLS